MEEEETIVEPGGIRRITASVIVDPSSLTPAATTNAAGGTGGTGAAGGSGAAANGGATAATVTRQDIEEIVKNVIGSMKPARIR